MICTRIAVMVVLSGALAACGGTDSAPTSASTKPSETPSSAAPTVLGPGPRTSQSASASSGPSARTAPTLADLEGYIADNFGSSTWFPSITGYRTVGDGELEVTTNLEPSATSSVQDAQAVCSATTDFFLVQEKAPLVRVTAGNGESLARRTALEDTCAL